MRPRDVARRPMMRGKPYELKRLLVQRERIPLVDTGGHRVALSRRRRAFFEKVVTAAQRLLCVLVDRDGDHLDVLEKIEQPEKQSIEAFIARQDVSSDDLVLTTPAAWGLFAARW
jgi:hypothetical protein